MPSLFAQALHKQASHLNYSSVWTAEIRGFAIFELLLKSRRGFQYIIEKKARLSKLVQVVQLRHICLMDVKQAFLKHLVYK